MCVSIGFRFSCGAGRYRQVVCYWHGSEWSTDTDYSWIGRAGLDLRKREEAITLIG